MSFPFNEGYGLKVGQLQATLYKRPKAILLCNFWQSSIA